MFISNEPSTYLGNPRSMLGNGGQVWAVAVSPSGKTLASVAGGNGNNEGAVILWDLAKGEETAAFASEKPIRCVAFSPDGMTLATGGFDRTRSCATPTPASCGTP